MTTNLQNTPTPDPSTGAAPTSTPHQPAPPAATTSAPSGPPPVATGRPRLLRRTRPRVLGGVASGLASYLDAPVWLVRTLFVAAFVFAGWGVVIYLLLWLLVPEQGRDHGALDNLLRPRR